MLSAKPCGQISPARLPTGGTKILVQVNKRIVHDEYLQSPYRWEEYKELRLFIAMGNLHNAKELFICYRKF